MRVANLWDFSSRMVYLKNEAKIWFLKSIIMDSSSTLVDWAKATFILKTKLRRFSKVKIINWCVVTGRARSVLRDFRLSWMEFKNYASRGLISGVKRWGF